MAEETTYIQMFKTLSDFHHRIFSAVKKDCRSEHLALDKQFLKKHFGAKDASKISTADLLSVYPYVIEGGHEELAEFIANRWLLKHMDIYNLFESELKKVNPQIDQIVEVPHQIAQDLLSKTEQVVHPIDCYIFCVFNDVKLPLDLMNNLRETASKSALSSEDEPSVESEIQNSQAMADKLQKVVEKYEKKLAGLQKKYIDDTNALRKQIAALQRKLSETHCNKV